MPINLIKIVPEVIASPLTEVINNYIEHSIFTSQWKIAKICPIPKTYIPLTSKDFRPISLLQILSKVFERIIMKQLCTFIEDRVIYSKTQSGFRKHQSINTLLIKIRDDILNALDRSEVAIAAMINFCKTFDTIDYFTVIRKVHSLNISTSTLNLMASYLTDRTQYVQVNEKFSSHKIVNFGVPQGVNIRSYFIQHLRK